VFQDNIFKIPNAIQHALLEHGQMVQQISAIYVIRAAKLAQMVLMINV